MQSNHWRAIRKLVNSGRHDDWARARALAQSLVAPPRQWLTTLLTDGAMMMRELGIELAIEHVPDTPGLAAHLVNLLDATRDAGSAQALILVLRTVTEPDDVARAIDMRLERLSNEDARDVRYQVLAARELREHQGHAYETLLLGLVDDRDADLRILAAQGLARLHIDRARQPLREALARARNTDEHFHLLLALSALAEPGLVPEFERALRQGVLRFAAFRALGLNGDAKAIPLLRKATRAWFGEPLDKVAAAAALTRLGDTQGATLLEKFSHAKRPEVRGYALEMMAELNMSGVEARLRAILEAADDPAAATAATLLIQFPSAATRHALQRATTHDPRPDVRHEAAQALSQLKESSS